MHPAPAGVGPSTSHYHDLESGGQFSSLANMPLAYAAKEIRAGFVRKVYGLVGAQMLVTAVISLLFSAYASPRWADRHAGLLVLSGVASVAVVVVFSCVPRVVQSYPLNYVLLAVFTLSEALLVGMVSSLYTVQSVIVVMGITACVVCSLSIYAMTTDKDMTASGPYLFALSLSILGVGLVGLLCGFPWIQVLYSGLMVVLCSLYIVYDTQMLIGGDRATTLGVDDYLMGALMIYMDVVNLFINLLYLLASRKD